jgi:hypothetical protein
MEDKKVEHLILLVGGNPLPNAVAGKLLVKPGGTITLIHSYGTADVAKRLRAWFQKHQVAQDVKLKEVKEGDPNSILDGMQECLNEAKPQTVGLNYTGGTKVMSVHAYRAVEQWSKERGITAVFSYLDAHTLEMVFDPVNAGTAVQRIYVGPPFRLNLDDLLTLHGWESSNWRNYPILPRTARKLLNVHAKEQTAQAWAEWLQEELFRKARRSKSVTINCPRSPDGQPCTIKEPTQTWLSQGNLKKVVLQWPSQPDLEEVIQTMKDELKQTDSLQLGNAAQACGYKDVEDFCKWLNGGWLESAVLDALQNCAHNCALHDTKMNLELTSGGNNPTRFEFDVVGMRGYQLFAISCSTDTQKGLLKLKLFEAYVRARQLGGDEARVALVCCSDDPEGLEDEMRLDVDPEKRIRVFGRKHLANLDKHLEEWIRSQIGADPEK